MDKKYYSVILKKDLILFKKSSVNKRLRDDYFVNGLDVIWKFALCFCTLFLTIQRKYTNVLQLAISWWDFFSGVEDNSYSSHCFFSYVYALRMRRKWCIDTQSIGESCIPEGIVISHSPSLSEPTMSRIRPSIRYSLFLPASVFLS